MNLSAEFDTRADRRAYALVATGAALLSYWHARAFFLPFMGPAGRLGHPADDGRRCLLARVRQRPPGPRRAARCRCCGPGPTPCWP